MGSGIIKRAISGDPEALTSLIDKYRDIAYNLAFTIAKNEEDAKDITQDSFLKVLENIHRFRNESKFTTWLYRIVYNQSIRFVKERNTENIINTGFIPTPENPDSEHNVEKEYSELYKAIDLLEENDRNIILLFYIAEKSIKQIGTITGMSVSNIKVILHRVRKKLYKKLYYERV